ncbi:MAG: glycosyltransferase family 2 protein, partial [Chthoniobacterales bacterium]
MPPKLAIVVPVFNEERCIENVLWEWQPTISQIEPNCCFLLFDDGSTDRTLALIESWAARQKPGTCRVVSHPNRGHGQTCLTGYRAACDLGAEWVLQIDSDGQCDPKYFAELWAKRHGNDVVYGKRVERRDGWKRVLATKLVRLVVRLASGADCTDANVPYRLMRTKNLRPLVDSIPPDFDLANIALAVQLKRAKWREASVPIVFRPRAGGEPSVPLSRFMGKATELCTHLARLPQPVRD